ncbi:MAG: hypothetical protein HYZ47_01780 [Simkania negevensis]|nr:hypothetical protein [Simkania negevensis]
MTQCSYCNAPFTSQDQQWVSQQGQARWQRNWKSLLFSCPVELLPCNHAFHQTCFQRFAPYRLSYNGEPQMKAQIGTVTCSVPRCASTKEDRGKNPLFFKRITITVGGAFILVLCLPLFLMKNKPVPFNVRNQWLQSLLQKPSYAQTFWSLPLCAAFVMNAVTNSIPNRLCDKIALFIYNFFHNTQLKMHDILPRRQVTTRLDKIIALFYDNFIKGNIEVYTDNGTDGTGQPILVPLNLTLTTDKRQFIEQVKPDLIQEYQVSSSHRAPGFSRILGCDVQDRCIDKPCQAGALFASIVAAGMQRRVINEQQGSHNLTVYAQIKENESLDYPEGSYETFFNPVCKLFSLEAWLFAKDVFD